MRRQGILAVAVAALAVTGCGGKSDKEKVETTVRDYFTAFADSDFDKACSELSDQTREALVEAMGQAISSVNARDMRALFEHCGYRAAVQSL